jgi:hypothetical protein
LFLLYFLEILSAIRAGKVQALSWRCSPPLSWMI